MNKSNVASQVYSVFEWTPNLGWRRVPQGIWFNAKTYAESQLKVLQSLYPRRMLDIKAAKSGIYVP